MTEKTPKQLAAELFERLSAGDTAGALGLMSPDVTWHVPGRPELSPVAGVYDKARLRRLFNRMQGQLDAGGMTMSVTGAVAEGDRVAAEVKSTGDLRNGRKYRQRYHFLITFREGKIVSVREYHDTQHAFDVWIRP
jgi:ketosteroid isomerase-like protein